MVRKIAIVGAHSSGKTSLVYALAAALKKRDKSVGVVIESVRRSPFPLGTKEFYDWVIPATILAEIDAAQGHEFLICDRTPADTLAYMKAAGFKIPDTLWNYLDDYLQSYESIVLLEPNRPIVDDGFRHTDEAHRDAVVKAFRETFITLKASSYKKEELYENAEKLAEDILNAESTITR